MSETENLKKKLLLLETEMTNPEVLANPNKLAELAKKYNQIKNHIFEFEKI